MELSYTGVLYQRKPLYTKSRHATAATAAKLLRRDKASQRDDQSTSYLVAPELSRQVLFKGATAAAGTG
jgi:hypothetical protein